MDSYARGQAPMEASVFFNWKICVLRAITKICDSDNVQALKRASKDARPPWKHMFSNLTSVSFVLLEATPNGNAQSVFCGVHPSTSTLILILILTLKKVPGAGVEPARP